MTRPTEHIRRDVDKIFRDMDRVFDDMDRVFSRAGHALDDAFNHLDKSFREMNVNLRGKVIIIEDDGKITVAEIKKNEQYTEPQQRKSWFQRLFRRTK